MVEDELDADSSDDEIQDMMKEAQDEILELKYDLEEARLDLTAEKKKVEHLETRVAAWIRAYFCASTLEAERLEAMDKLATYYLEHAKKIDEEKKASKAELELFRANYVRYVKQSLDWSVNGLMEWQMDFFTVDWFIGCSSQKETESYRQQIIELQAASSREIERIQQAKTKNEKDAQDTITTLRRQLADAVVHAEVNKVIPKGPAAKASAPSYNFTTASPQKHSGQANTQPQQVRSRFCIFHVQISKCIIFNFTTNSFIVGSFSMETWFIIFMLDGTCIPPSHRSIEQP